VGENESAVFVPCVSELAGGTPPLPRGRNSTFLDIFFEDEDENDRF
jgi:hypothetical protein